MSITIDIQEKPKELRERARLALHGVVEHLECGDYLVVGKSTSLVERKTTDNLVSSVVHKTAGGAMELYDQLERCLKTGHRVVLLVEGDIWPHPYDAKKCWVRKEKGVAKEREVPYMAIVGVLLKVQEMGVQVIWTDTFDTTLLVLQYLERR